MSDIAEIIRQGSKDAREILAQGTETISALDELRTRPFQRKVERASALEALRGQKLSNEALKVGTISDAETARVNRDLATAAENRLLSGQLSEEKLAEDAGKRAERSLALQEKEFAEEAPLRELNIELAKEQVTTAQLTNRQKAFELAETQANPLVDQAIAMHNAYLKGEIMAYINRDNIMLNILQDDGLRPVLKASVPYGELWDATTAEYLLLSPEEKNMMYMGLDMNKKSYESQKVQQASRLADMQAEAARKLQSATSSGAVEGTASAYAELGIPFEGSTKEKGPTDTELTNMRKAEGDLWSTIAKDIEIKKKGPNAKLKDLGVDINNFANMDQATFEAERDAMYKLVNAVTTLGTFSFGGKTFTFDKKNIEENINSILEAAQSSDSGMFMGTSPYYTMLNYLKGENLKGWEKIAETTGVKQNVGAAAAKLKRSVEESQ